MIDNNENNRNDQNNDYNNSNYLNPVDSLEELPEDISEELPEDSLDDYSNEKYESEMPLENENGAYNSHNRLERKGSQYYKDRQKELDDNVKKARNEKNRNFKKTNNEPIQADGSNTKNKNSLDKVKDRVNLLNAQKESLNNKLNGIGARAHEMAHPIDTLKDKTKDKAKEAAKDGMKKAVKSIISKVPIWVWLIIAGLLLLLFLIVILFFMLDDDNDSNNNITAITNDACQTFSLNKTTLSKDEFVSKATDYFAQKEQTDTIKEFVSNLDNIYSDSVKSNINPELVVVRAVAEGLSPGISKHSYWGMGCSNTGGYDACTSYIGFEEGLTDFLRYVSQYDSVESMMSKYAYIGKYWYNPGGSGLGGCYYFPYIKEYMSAARATEVQNACDSSKSCNSNGEGDCLATTDEDQKAYAKRNVANMANIRKQIFGLEPTKCTFTTSCTLYSQGDKRWGDIHLGTSSATMASAGCAVTSIAIGISCAEMDQDITVANFDAGVFINELNDGECLTEQGYIKWGCTRIRQIAPSITYISQSNINGSASEKRNNIMEATKPSNSSKKRFVIVGLHPNGGNGTHYVVFLEDSGDGNSFSVMDTNGKITIEQYEWTYQRVIYEYSSKN